MSTSEAITPSALQVGPYFTVVSLLPATLFVTYVRWLFATGAAGRHIDWTPGAVFELSGAAVTVAVAVVLALALNPLQFGLVQVLEGYWGSSGPASIARAARILHHRRRASVLNTRLAAGSPPMFTSTSGDTVKAESEADESARLLRYYPPDPRDMMPTRLGNVLRRYEFLVGRTYGLELIPSIPRLAMVAKEPEIAYLQNQRLQLELAVRTAVLAFIAALVTFVVMLRHGWPLLLTLAPYALAYLAYRGAILLAHEYGTAMAVMLELNRFALYDRLRLPVPGSTLDERAQNPEVMASMKDFQTVNIRFRPAQPVDPDAADPSAG